MPGLFDQLATPEGQGLLAGLFGTLAGANRGAPLNALGRGGLAGLAGYAGAQNMQLKTQEELQQRQMRELQMKTSNMQLDEMRRKMTDEATARETAMRYFQPGTPAAGGMVDNQLPPEFQTGAAPVPAQAPKFDMLGYAQARMSQNPMEGQKLMSELQKLRPEFSTTPQQMMVGGKLTNVLIAKDGTTRTLDGMGVKPDIQLQELGGRVQAIDKNAIAGGQVFEKSGDPFSSLILGDGKGGFVPNAPLVKVKTAIANAGAARHTVEFKQEGEEAKTVGKFFGDNYAKVQEAGMNAQGSMNRYGRLGQLLDGVETGKFAPTGLEAAKAAQAFGFKVDPKLANKEAAVALTSEMALQLRNPSGGAGMPGAMSDADREFLQGMVPGIEKTPDGRKQIIETAKKMAQRDIEVARMAREYRKKNGNLNEGFYDELSRYSAANPLFGNAQTSPAAQPKPSMRWDPKAQKLVPVN